MTKKKTHCVGKIAGCAFCEVTVVLIYEAGGNLDITVCLLIHLECSIAFTLVYNGETSIYFILLITD